MIFHKFIYKSFLMVYLIMILKNSGRYHILGQNRQDSTLLCTCMFIVNQGMLCRHQYRILIQSDKAIFHTSLIHTRWFNTIPSDSIGFITIVNRERKHTTIPLNYITHLRTNNVYTPVIKE